MKLTLKQNRALIMGVGVVGLILMVLGRLSTTGEAAEIAGLICVAVALLASFFWLRCPHCGAWLGNNEGDHCQYCGEKLDWE